VGRVARIFLDGWTRAQKLSARIVVADPNTDTKAPPARFQKIKP